MNDTSDIVQQVVEDLIAMRDIVRYKKHALIFNRLTENVEKILSITHDIAVKLPIRRL